MAPANNQCDLLLNLVAVSVVVVPVTISLIMVIAVFAIFPITVTIMLVAVTRFIVPVVTDIAVVDRGAIPVLRGIGINVILALIVTLVAVVALISVIACVAVATVVDVLMHAGRDAIAEKCAYQQGGHVIVLAMGVIAVLALAVTAVMVSGACGRGTDRSAQQQGKCGCSEDFHWEPRDALLRRSQCCDTLVSPMLNAPRHLGQ